MFRHFTVQKIVQESDTIRSFYLAKTNREEVEDYLPGQFITVGILINGEQFTRNYTLSDAPGKGYFRLTVKREEKGKVSKYLHDVLKEGGLLNISKPTGKFHINIAADNPIVLISGGVGITPMLSMAEYAAAHQPNRKVYFLHSSIDKQVQPMSKRLREIQAKHPGFELTIFHTTPQEDELKGVDFDEKGFITRQYLEAMNIEKGADYYLCGPVGFMEAMYNALIEMKIPETNIAYEFFGDGKLSGAAPKFTDSKSAGLSVTFSKSGVSANWPEGISSLLELAEVNGLSPAFSCRMGTCSTCETRMISGEITYDPEPFMEPQTENIFICCAKPVSDVIIDL